MSKTVATFVKSGLNLAKKVAFTSIIHDTNVTVGFKLLTTDNGVMCAGKEIKSDLRSGATVSLFHKFDVTD